MYHTFENRMPYNVVLLPWEHHVFSGTSFAHRKSINQPSFKRRQMCNLLFPFSWNIITVTKRELQTLRFELLSKTLLLIWLSWVLVAECTGLLIAASRIWFPDLGSTWPPALGHTKSQPLRPTRGAPQSGFLKNLQTKWRFTLEKTNFT